MELGEPVSQRSRNARRHTELRSRLRQIAASVDVDVTFVPADQAGVDRLHAYRVLAHAEIEAFIEYLADTALDVSAVKLSSGVVTHAAHHLVVTWSIARLRTNPARARYPYFRCAEAVAAGTSDLASFHSAIDSHREGVKNNHGLKNANVRKLLLPVGYREEFFEPGLLDKLDDFGERRGSVAHATGVVGTTNWSSGSTELAATAALLPGLRRLEQVLPRLLQPA